MGRLHSDGLERGMIITISHHLRSIEGKDCHIWGLEVENGIEQAVGFPVMPDQKARQRIPVGSTNGSWSTNKLSGMSITSMFAYGFVGVCV